MTLRAIAALRAKVGADAGMLRAAAEQERPSPRRRVVEDGIVGTQAIRLPRVGVVAITIAK